MSVDSLEIFGRRISDRYLSALAAVVDTHLCTQPLLEPLLQLDDRSRSDLLRATAERLTLCLPEPDRLLDPSHRPPLCNSPLGDVDRICLVLGSEQRTRMPCR